MRAFRERGYNIVLLRDATTGLEYHDTVNDLLATRMAIREIENIGAFSCLTEDFIQACNNASPCSGTDIGR